MLRSRSLRFARRAALAAAAFVSLGACSNSDAGNLSGPSDPATEQFASSLGINLSAMTELASRLFVQDLTVGTGAEAAAGKRLRVRYTGWLRNGQVFDSNANGNPFEFDLGLGQVIPGWDIGVAGMRVGGKRRLVFGSQYGYGAQGSGPIPRNATLIFDVELIGVLN
jgi:FKBP-type peptidyl-prolyl cis-trans isomerase